MVSVHKGLLERQEPKRPDILFLLLSLNGVSKNTPNLFLVRDHGSYTIKAGNSVVNM